MALLLACAVLFGVLVTAYAADAADPQGGLIAVAFRGETTEHTPNTPEAVLAAAEAGADLVSVAVTKTADGQFVLLTDAQKALVNETQTFSQMQIALFGASSSLLLPTLETVADLLDSRAGLIVDFDISALDALCAYLREHALTDSVLPRVNLPAKTIVSFTEANPDIRLLGVYRGNVVMNADAFLLRLSAAGLPIVQYQNKNYFCVSFQKFTADRFSKNGNCRAMVNMTKKELCGQRDDSVTGWDDMISRGFSVIETGDIRGLCAYIAQQQATKQALLSSLETAKQTDLSALRAQSAKALSNAIAAGEDAKGENASLSARQSALSALQNASATKVPRGEDETRKGALQITTGKVLTVLFFAVLVLAVQIYFHKKQGNKGEDHYAKKEHH